MIIDMKNPDSPLRTKTSDITMEKLLNYSAAYLKQAASSSPQLDSLVLLEYATRQPRSWLLSRTSEPTGILQGPSLQEYEKLIRRRAKGEPVAYLVGVKEFYGLELVVTPAVLIPRPESETLVDLAIELAPPNSSLIDVGTGSGAIALAVAKDRTDLKVAASDISADALEVVEINAKKHGIPIQAFRSDMLDKVKDTYETVLANLPYVSSNFQSDTQKELDHEPPQALYGGSDGLDLYRRLMDGLTDYKTAKLLIIEADPRQHQELTGLASERGWVLKKQADYALAFETRLAPPRT